LRFNTQVLRPFPQFSNVTLVAPKWGNSNYQVLNIKAEKRLSHGLNFQANDTYARFIDDVAGRFALRQPCQEQAGDEA
jgi:hypothetical protein